MDDQNADGGFIVEMRVYGFDSKDAARLYVEALTSAFCAMPESAPYASTTGIVTSEEHLAEMNVEALQARVAELETEAERRDEQIRDMIEASGQTCACGYDKASDICLGHLSHFRKSVATARRDAFEEAAKYHDNFLMTQTGTSVEKVVASTEAIRALAEKG